MKKNLSSKIITHRGAWKDYNLPQNSLAALNKSFEMGYFQTEFDVRLTKDNVLVINHDISFHHINIEKTLFKNLSNYTLVNGEMLPTFVDFVSIGLKIVPKCQLYCEIKTESKDLIYLNQLAIQVTDTIQSYQAENIITIICFNLELLVLIGKLNAAIKTQYLGGDKNPFYLKEVGISGINYNLKAYQTNLAWFNQAKELNLSTNIWTLNKVNEMKLALKMGFDLITTDLPNTLQKIILDGDFDDL
jgi:glycerophosphoryl diester phosphodiesterase